MQSQYRPKFQQRHYEAIAQAFQRARREAEKFTSEDERLAVQQGINIVLIELNDIFKYDNGLYDSYRFHKACVPGANVRARC